MEKKNKAIFLGSKSFGLRLLLHLISLNPHIKWQVICPNDSNDSRSYEHAFREFCKDNVNISSIEFPHSKTELYKVLEKNDVLIGVVCGWYSILSDEILEIPKRGFWGIHHSLLPKYRGFSPLVWSIANGDEIVGSTIFKITSKMDAGDYVAQVQVENTPDKSIEQIMLEIECGILKKLSENWKYLEEGNAKLFSQNELLATYARKRNEDDGKIDWTLPSIDIHNLIRAMSRPYPGAFFTYQGEMYKVFKSEVENLLTNSECGRILETDNNTFVVCCGNGTAIRLFKENIETTKFESCQRLKPGAELS